jgi:hypothetical protein
MTRSRASLEDHSDTESRDIDAPLGVDGAVVVSPSAPGDRETWYRGVYLTSRRER